MESLEEATTGLSCDVGHQTPIDMTPHHHSKNRDHNQLLYRSIYPSLYCCISSFLHLVMLLEEVRTETLGSFYAQFIFILLYRVGHEKVARVRSEA